MNLVQDKYNSFAFVKTTMKYRFP